MKVGVLGLQGDVSEHLGILKRCGCRGVIVKNAHQIKELDGLIIPGGESTTIGKLLSWYGLDKVLNGLTGRGFPVFGTCAGLILLAKTIAQKEQSKIGVMDIEVKRNAFGRQQESFEAELDIPALGKKPYPAVFIRAPYITRVNKGVKVLARFEDKIVFAQKDNLLVSAFHPELTQDLRVHEYFLKMINGGGRNGQVKRHRSRGLRGDL